MPSSDTLPVRLKRLLTFIEHDAGNLALRKDAVREACDTGHWDVARSLIDAGLLMNANEPDLLAYSGFAYLQVQRYGDAEQALSAALALGVDAAAPRYNLGFALFMQARHAEAFELLGDPSLPEAVPRALLLRARCLHHLGRQAEAIEECTAHLACTPDDAETLGLLALLLYEQGCGETARRHMEAALQRDPNQLEARLVLASMQSDAREFDDARHSFQSLLEVHPQCGRAWLGLALIELSNQQVAAAQRDIERAAVYVPQHIGTWHVLAWIHLMRGNVVAGQAAFEKALAIDRNFGETHGGLAVVAALQERENDALAGIKRALRLDPRAMSPRYAEIVLLQRHNQHAEAQAVLEEVLARPTARGDMLFRDLVALQMQHLGSRPAEDSGVVYH